EVPGSAALNSGGEAEVDDVSCAASGACTAAGSYKDAYGDYQAFVVDETSGAWGTAVEVPGLAALNIGGFARSDSVSAGAAGTCAAGGYYADGYGKFQTFVVDETSGSWGTAVEVPGSAALNKGGVAWGIALSCAASGMCAAGGFYTDKSGHFRPFVADEASG